MLAVLALLAGGLWRSSHLANRPLHADEAVQAWLTWNLLHGEGYRYDPLDRHGPLIYFGAAGFHTLRGRSADEFNDVSARSFTLLAGLGTLALIGFAPRLLGGPGSVGPFAVLLLSTETLSTLYQTYFVQEAWLAGLVWAFVFLLRAPPSTRRTLLLGLVAGLAQTAKEIAPFYLLLAWAAVRYGESRPAPTTFVPRRLAWFGAAWLLPVLLFYSSFGAHPQGIIDALRTYPLQFQRIAGDAHHYPWWRTLETLGLLSAKPVLWAQLGFLALALIGTGLACRRSAPSGLRSTALFTFGLLLLHSLIPYKTPWLLLTPTIGFALLGGYALSHLATRGKLATGAALILAAATIAHSAHVGRLALDRYPGDPRNPYFYEQAPRAFQRLPERIEQLRANLNRPLTIAVVSDEHAWPLPWYLRRQPQVGYIDDIPPTNLADWDVVVWDSQHGELPPELGPPRMVEFVGLRPNVVLTISIAPAVWEATFPPLP